MLRLRLLGYEGKVEQVLVGLVMVSGNDCRAALTNCVSDITSWIPCHYLVMSVVGYSALFLSTMLRFLSI